MPSWRCMVVQYEAELQRCLIRRILVVSTSMVCTRRTVFSLYRAVLGESVSIHPANRCTHVYGSPTGETDSYLGTTCSEVRNRVCKNRSVDECKCWIRATRPDAKTHNQIEGTQYEFCGGFLLNTLTLDDLICIDPCHGHLALLRIQDL